MNWPSRDTTWRSIINVAPHQGAACLGSAFNRIRCSCLENGKVGFITSFSPFPLRKENYAQIQIPSVFTQPQNAFNSEDDKPFLRNVGPFIAHCMTSQNKDDNIQFSFQQLQSYRISEIYIYGILVGDGRCRFERFTHLPQDCRLISAAIGPNGR